MTKRSRLLYSFHNCSWIPLIVAASLSLIIQALTIFGVSKVVASGHQDFKAGDLVWGWIGCEEYSLITHPENLFKINHPELPLSYYTGVLGEYNFIFTKLFMFNALKNNHV